MSTVPIVFSGDIERRLRREAEQREAEARRRQEVIAGLDRDLVAHRLAIDLEPGDMAQVWPPSSETDRELAEELRAYIKQNATRLWPSPEEQRRLRALIFAPADSSPAATTPKPAGSSVLEFLDALPPGPRSFGTWKEVEQHLQTKRESWDR